MLSWGKLLKAEGIRAGGLEKEKNTQNSPHKNPPTEKTVRINYTQLNKFTLETPLKQRGRSLASLALCVSEADLPYDYQNEDFEAFSNFKSFVSFCVVARYQRLI